MNVLLNERRFDAAIYLAGYAIECYLKYLITISQHITKLPADFETHDLNYLAAKALKPEDWISMTKSNKAFEQIMDEWHSELRYHCNANPSHTKVFCIRANLVYDQLKELKP